MDTLPIKRKKPCRSRARKNSWPTLLFLPEDLLAEILPFFNVKTIIQLKCLSKSWKTFISDSNFIEKHLKISSQNPHLTLFSHQRSIRFNVVPFPVNYLLKNPCNDLYYSKTFQRSKHRLDERLCEFIGSCNGLLCLLLYNVFINFTPTVQLCFWNPATRTKSKKFGSLGYRSPDFCCFHFTFGYDASTKIYKVVAFRVRKNGGGSLKSEVKVFNVGDNRWRNIQSFPVVPYFKWIGFHYEPQSRLFDGVHFSGTVNWLALDKSTGVEHFVIVSLDLSTETYRQFRLPAGFDELSSFEPDLRILMDCLCFSQDSNKTELVLWQMKEYGVQESWTQLFKISYENLHGHNIHYAFELVCLYVNGDEVIFANKVCKLAFIYNLKDKTIKIIKSKVWIHWFDKAKDYVESLVSVC